MSARLLRSVKSAVHVDIIWARKYVTFGCFSLDPDTTPDQSSPLPFLPLFQHQGSETILPNSYCLHCHLHGLTLLLIFSLTLLPLPAKRTRISPVTYFHLHGTILLSGSESHNFACWYICLHSLHPDITMQRPALHSALAETGGNRAPFHNSS